MQRFSGGIAQWFAYQSPMTMALFLRCYELGGVSGICLLFASWLNADVVAMIFLRHNGND